MFQLLRFHADWCSPCKQLAPIIEQIDKDMPDVEVKHVNVDHEPEIAGDYGIMSVPTLVLLKDGQPVQRMSGFQPKERVAAMINSQR